jgi:hypothetical protein
MQGWFWVLIGMQINPHVCINAGRYGALHEDGLGCLIYVVTWPLVHFTLVLSMSFRKMVPCSDGLCGGKYDPPPQSGP